MSVQPHLVRNPIGLDLILDNCIDLLKNSKMLLSLANREQILCLERFPACY